MSHKPAKRFLGTSTPIPKWSIGVIGVFLLAIGIWIGFSAGERNETGQKHAPVAFAPQTMAVAKQFACSCGACGEKNLAVCACPTANSTKKFIEMNLNEGMNKEDAVILVKDIYGHYTG